MGTSCTGRSGWLITGELPLASNRRSICEAVQESETSCQAPMLLIRRPRGGGPSSLDRLPAAYREAGQAGASFRYCRCRLIAARP
jgi:hypothetical protein